MSNFNQVIEYLVFGLGAILLMISTDPIFAIGVILLLRGNHRVW